MLWNFTTEETVIFIQQAEIVLILFLSVFHMDLEVLPVIQPQHHIE